MHNYERFLPVYNGTSDPKWKKTPNLIRGATDPIHVVTGAAGNVEGQESFGSPLPFSTARSMEYGYNRMLVHNDTHMEWIFVVTDNSTQSSALVDSMWTVKQ